MTRKKKQIRPRFIHFEIRDPWKDEFLAGATLCYSPERAARGHFSKTIRRFHAVATKECWPRKPELIIRRIA
ncbi:MULTISPECIES: hypothetical protein [unclassified Herbaspirillum]|uniref:hypothetical protein n=1 Tax=unclassified Herbaspirillum TaxID=2624150 RepID=UPI00257A19E9|nr:MULTISPECIES: hypothetical protein [unclassified Herbaspirillum]|tara:strand:+ start:1051 stop:1266 length:216 start_codon:yes stop_codon:yes gene_type:complete